MKNKSSLRQKNPCLVSDIQSDFSHLKHIQSWSNAVHTGHESTRIQRKTEGLQGKSDNWEKKRMKEEIGITGGTCFTEQNKQKSRTKTYMMMDFKYINYLHKEEEIKIFIFTGGSKKINWLLNETEKHLSQMTQLNWQCIEREDEWKKRRPFRIYFSLTFYTSISVK